MSWFVAKIVSECLVDDETSSPLFDEQIFVLEADDSENAYQKALEIGRGTDTSYENNDGNLVTWKFRGLSHLDEILSDSIVSGTEITNVLHKNKIPNDFIPKKEELTIFWTEKNKDKIAYELLDDDEISHAPR